MSDNPLWIPSSDRQQQARLTKFRDWLEDRGHSIGDGYEGLHQWSIQNPEKFWEAIWCFFEVRGQYQAQQIIDKPTYMLGAQWFGGTYLNFADNLLSNHTNKTAIIECREDGRCRQLTYNELHDQSARLAGTLKAYGVGKGDRVAAVVSNGIEAVVGMLAATRLGAVWSSCSPDFGYRGLLERFGQIKPKVLIVVNGYQYNGKQFDIRQRITDLTACLPGLLLQIHIDNQEHCPWGIGANGTLSWEDAITGRAITDFTPMSFNDPLYILYSSGTTGAPKCIVHGVGGTLLQHLKELGLHTDIRPDDVVFYYTTCGWMMWNWLVSTLSLGATIMLYDGSPMAETADILWKLAEEHKINVFGASARYYASCEKAGLKPSSKYNLASLRTILSTGSVLSHESFDYIYREIKEDVCLSSISGGTDIISCFALGNPTLPVYRGELQCIGLGMDVAIFQDDGKPIVGEKGELVCRKPFPSMPICFWNDPGGKRYRNAYFDRFSGVWAHGDFGEIREHASTTLTPMQRGVVIHGRSDAVLNPGGVRIGTAEIYRQVEKIDAVLESLAIGQQWQNDVRVILFVCLRAGAVLDEALEIKIKDTVRYNATPRHVPAVIIQVPDIPRTISGKIVELSVRNIIHDEPVKNMEALANPECLNYFKNLEQLKK